RPPKARELASSGAAFYKIDGMTLKTFASIVCVCFVTFSFANSEAASATMQSTASPIATPMPQFDPTKPYEVVATPSPSTRTVSGFDPDAYLAAKTSDSDYQTGMKYYNGNGVEKNYSEAAKWFRKAAEQNDPRAQLALAACYFEGGQGVRV